MPTCNLCEHESRGVSEDSSTILAKCHMSKYSWHVAPSRQCEEIQGFRGLSSDWKILRSTTDSCSAFLGWVACLVKSDAQGPHFHQRLGHEELNKSHPQHSSRTSPQRSHMLTHMGKSSGLYYVRSTENRSMITLAVSTLPPLALGEGLASPPSSHGIRLWTFVSHSFSNEFSVPVPLDSGASLRTSASERPRTETRTTTKRRQWSYLRQERADRDKNNVSALKVIMFAVDTHMDNYGYVWKIILLIFCSISLLLICATLGSRAAVGILLVFVRQPELSHELSLWSLAWPMLPEFPAPRLHLLHQWKRSRH